MKKILNGVLEYQRDISPEERRHLESLASGQQPEAMLITCADSRIEPGRITRTKPGELFIVRNVGNIVPIFGETDPHVQAAVEYALEVLNVRHIIICGHTHCGAMDAVLHPEKLETLPAVAAWLKQAGDLRRVDGPDALNHLIEQNVLTQIGNLRTYPSVARLLKKAELQIHGWVYDIATGGVLSWHAPEGRFVPITAVAGHTLMEEMHVR
jgi:carbonic anhydrase